MQVDKQELSRVVLSDDLEVCPKPKRWARHGQHWNDHLRAKAPVEHLGNATTGFSYERRSQRFARRGGGHSS